MASDLLGLSVSGLRASQSALNTTGHNISNANTEGYSRQRVNTVANPATYVGVGYIGSGVNIESIERIANDFVSDQLRTDTTLLKEVDVFYSQVGALDNLLSNTATGLSSAMETFFGAMQNGSNDPTSIPARQLIISETQNLADRFNSIYARMDAIGEGVNSAMDIAVAQINALTSNIATLNLKISDALGVSNGAPPNDLLDQREEALRKLSELVAIQTFDEGGGPINVIVGSGQALVVGNQSQNLVLQPDPSDVKQKQLLLQRDNKTFPVSLNGGELGGLLRFREDSLNATFNTVGRIAIAIAQTFNEQHQQGVNFNNQFGSNIFNDVNAVDVARERVIGHSQNPLPANQVMSLLIRDSGKLSDSNYDMTIEGGGLYRIKRRSDDAEVATGLLPGTFPFSATFDGLELQFEGGIFQAGDRFALRPTQEASRDFARVIVNPEDLAFASPLSTQSALGNLGSGKISAGEVLSLVDAADQPLPLLATPGEMNPPLVVKFTSATTYDILDNTDPGQPVQLQPPIRNRVYVQGADNKLFPDNPLATQVTAAGDLLGLPEGRRPVMQAAVVPSNTAPSFAVTDFSAPSQQFSFDVTVSETLSGTNDGTYSIRINQPALADSEALLEAVNSQLSTSGVRAFITDAGSLGFHRLEPGYGNITLGNYNPDPDSAGGPAPAGQANTLLGFAIESSSFTSANAAQGVAGFGSLKNGYPSEVFTLEKASLIKGGPATVYNFASAMNGSAKSLAAQFNNVPGVAATAFTRATLTDFNVTQTEPLQVTLNGENLLPYSFDAAQGAFILSDTVPDPVAEPNKFADFLVKQVNSNPQLKNMGIYASASTHPITGKAEVSLFAKEGDDLALLFTAAAGESLGVNDTQNPNLTLLGAGTGMAVGTVVGGRLDVVMGEGLSLTTVPEESLIFGNTAAAQFAQSNYLGIQASINGTPQAGDSFVLDFNKNAAMDNRNALSLVNLQAKKTMGQGISSFSESYGSVVESVGIQTNAAKINSEAAKQVLVQTTQLRDSISGVNMDEEAANLIKYEQLYSANARVIQVARDLFNTLLQSFG
jgi:flagellar hook-associated protein 1